MEVSNEEKNDLINKIVISMWDEIGEQAAKRLQAALYVNLSGYDVRKISTELTVYDEKNTADYFQNTHECGRDNMKSCTGATERSSLWQKHTEHQRSPRSTALIIM